MLSLTLKNCPRCRGDVIIDRDHYGWYEQCLQCGYQRDLRDIDRINQPAGNAAEGMGG